LTFARFAEQLDQGLAPDSGNTADDVETRMLVEEMKLGCTQGMLLCLDRDHRLAYILGHVIGLASGEAAEILGVTSATFRKRLSRSRERLHAFMERKCGLVNAANPCHCARRIDHAIAIGRIDPANLLFAGHPRLGDAERSTRIAVHEMERLYTAADLLRNHPTYAAPGMSAEALRAILKPGRLQLLKD
jgi:hypothetical protein